MLVLESFLEPVLQVLRPATLFKQTPTQVFCFPVNIEKSFKDTYFEEHLRMTASE